ncbi:hypothetical protein GTP44_13040 [Duganella sp. FT50W]|uniref:Transposase IS66 C-terminal domain-containing protein n=1 Tax=Duganella lactea TaxID=2692173 RepID=A0A6L8MID3_9BURK|nr:transposase domain-containing protein [Duganella lactea]MYM82880.1 hypothetical protein [Duganella lactea]
MESQVISGHLEYKKFRRGIINGALSEERSSSYGYRSIQDESRQVRPVATGRKNWLFADTVDGMRANALMYSLVQTAKANDLNPHDYLRHVFMTLPYLKTAAEVESLLPWNLPQLRRAH